MKVALTGITGYAGLQLYYLLSQHPKVEAIQIYQHDLEKPEHVAKLNPRLSEVTALAKPYDSGAIMEENDVLFLATPAGVSSHWAQPYLAANFPVIDLSGDFRLKNPAQYEKWYQKDAASKDALAQAYYGLADLKENPGQHYVANPGCYPTATLLGLAPLVKQNLIEVDSILVDAKSGLTGAGKALKKANHFVQANENLQVYKPNQHQHIPEILQMLQSWNPDVKQLQFMTTLVPVDRGIMASIYVKVKAGITEEKLEQAFREQYANAPFVFIQEEGLPDLKSVVGTNNCRIGLAYNPETKYLLVVSVIDNMLKGASGQAVQNFNQLFDFSSTAGLHLQPLAF
ncbi:N-acetyl-gamma-glutamyl-phosphate reductase [Eupransor demetentiae]|uniref:N-acetyl-gamma-glutamyl-phosphate reductase n=1 Tax=Eupransor demetentiae TaxID=3109584 RepID=A0ABP0ETI7_9LACO|nr:N-acetyl-gamma-glutamylphosphate reductase (ArgC) [Lactobacillaceae bacterium LMG 33000]